MDTQYIAVDSSRETFRRDTGDAMRARYAEVHAKSVVVVDALERGRDAAVLAQWSVASAQAFLASKKAAALSKGFDVQPDGTCSISESTKQRVYLSVATEADNGPIANKFTTAMAALQVEANNHTTWVKAALAGAVDADNAAKNAIEAAFANMPTADSFGNASTTPTGTPQPPQGATPAQNLKWWDSLSRTEQTALINTVPTSIGNLDGLPAPVRDEANRKMIPFEQDRLTADSNTFAQALKTAGENGDMAGIAAAQTGLDRTTQKLSDLAAVRTAMEGSTEPKRYLMALDMQSGRQGRAAVAVGNPDTADHISVTTPGLGSDLSSSLLGGRGGDGKWNPSGGMVGEAETLIETSQRQLADAGRGGEQISSIAWFGYDPPQGGMGSLDDITTPDMINVTNEGRAQEAAQPLSSFYTGLDVASEKSDPHITALGHSYGSLATSLALQEQSGVVDDVVFYGSPGLGADIPGLPGVGGLASPFSALGLNDAVENAGDLGVRNGHVYEMTEHWDPVGNLDAFGRSPNEMPWVTHLSTDPISVNGETYTGATNHSEYGRTDGTTQNLHRSGYNLAAIVAGLPENATNPQTDK
ncbi:alpha/beta hydrolase [Nocardia sp. NPDC058640]|uniref:alpha/beta hydrolase n=1 Tax=Nocardia sp. NPDC058640 TaxID=3346571 RepID=UPI00364F04F6